MMARIAVRTAYFAGLVFTLVTAIDSVAAGGVTLRIVTRAATVAVIAGAVYAAIRSLIAWVKS